MPAMRQAAGRRVPTLRPLAAAGLEFLSVLRQEHRDQTRRQASARARAADRDAARAAGGQRRRVQEIAVTSNKTHYENLELPPGATAEEIKKSFRALIARYHPD